jgi:hypothetical protein
MLPTLLATEGHLTPGKKHRSCLVPNDGFSTQNIISIWFVSAGWEIFC